MLLIVTRANLFQRTSSTRPCPREPLWRAPHESDGIPSELAALLTANRFIVASYRS